MTKFQTGVFKMGQILTKLKPGDLLQNMYSYLT